MKTKYFRLVRANQSFTRSRKQLAARIPRSWIHAIIVVDFVASFPNGEATIYEVMGLNEIEDPVTDLNVFVPFQQA